MCYVSGFGGTDTRVWQRLSCRASAGGSDNQRTWVSKPCSSVRPCDAGRGTRHRANREFQKGDFRGRSSSPRPRRPSPLCASCPSSAVSGRIMGLYDSARYSMGGRDFDHLDHRGRRDGLEVGHVLAVYRNVVIYDQKGLSEIARTAPRIQLPRSATAGLHLPYFRFDFLCAGKESSRRCKARYRSEP